jgi:tetratricopeptide (TPR) repeat protein
VTPALAIVDTEGEPIGLRHGYSPPEEILAWLKKTRAASRRIVELRDGARDDPKVWRERADLFGSVGADGRALECYARALELIDEKDAAFRAETLARQGLAHYRNEEKPETLARAAEALRKLDPDGKLGVRDDAALLDALAGLGKPSELSAAVDEALSKHPDSNCLDGLWVVKACYLWQAENDPAGARKLFDRVIEKFPDSFFASTARECLRQLAR